MDIRYSLLIVAAFVEGCSNKSEMRVYIALQVSLSQSWESDTARRMAHFGCCCIRETDGRGRAKPEQVKESSRHKP